MMNTIWRSFLVTFTLAGAVLLLSGCAPLRDEWLRSLPLDCNILAKHISDNEKVRNYFIMCNPANRI